MERVTPPSNPRARELTVDNGGEFKQFVSVLSKIFPASTIIYHSELGDMETPQPPIMSNRKEPRFRFFILLLGGEGEEFNVHTSYPFWTFLVLFYELTEV